MGGNIGKKGCISKPKNRGELVFRCELLVFGISAAFFALCCFDIVKLGDFTVSIIYIVFSVLVLVYNILLNTFLKRLDGACHTRMFRYGGDPRGYNVKECFNGEKHLDAEHGYGHGENLRMLILHRRRGAGFVVCAYFVFLSILAVLKFTGIMSVELFLLGASMMFLANTFFIHRYCLLRIVFMRNVGCCADCGIAGWDYLIFGSALLFAPELPVRRSTGYAVNAVIFVCSLIYFIIWEYNIKKYPERFAPETNMLLSCKNCGKRCVKKIGGPR